MTTPITDWVKDPDAVLDWHFDWSGWLASGESITTSLMTVSAGITLASFGNSGTSTVAWLSGGTPGVPYTLANRVVTSQGRTDERTITIRVTNR